MFKISVIKRDNKQSKRKVAPVLLFFKLSTMPWRCTGGVEVQLHAFLTLAIDGGEWSASCPSCFTYGERASSIHWIGGWVGPSTEFIHE